MTAGFLLLCARLLRVPPGALVSRADHFPFAALRLRTDAAKRFKRVEHATPVIWKTLQIAEQKFRRLNTPELMKRMYLGVEHVDGIQMTAHREETAA